MSSKQSSSRLSTLHGSKLNPRGASKLLDRSKINKRHGSTNHNNSRSGSRLESRFMSRMKSSMIGKYKSGYRKKGSSKYSAVRENGDPIIWRDDVDVTPLPIQIDNIVINNENYNNMNNKFYSDNDNNNKNDAAQCFIPLTDKICHPMSFNDINDEKKDKNRNKDVDNNNIITINIGNLNKNNNNSHSTSSSSNDNNNQKRRNNATIISYPNDNEIDIIQNNNKFNEYIQNNSNILDENININLRETNTEMLFEMPSLAISNRETSISEKEKIIKINKDYEYCLLKHSDKDLFTTSCTQTYNPPLKQQSISVIPPKVYTKCTQSSKYDIHDSFKTDNTLNDNKNNNNMIIPPYIDLTTTIIKKMNDSSSFKSNLMKMERAIIQNVIAEKQMLYRMHSKCENKEKNEFESDDDDDDNDQNNKQTKALIVSIDVNPIDPTKDNLQNKLNDNTIKDEIKADNDKEKDIKVKKSSIKQDNILSNVPVLHKLWNYSCPSCVDLSCTALDFNPLNTDLIVGGYGSWDFGNKLSGKIMFWTLKNPTNPCRIYNISDTCVVSLNFSRIHPYLLAVGLFDGSVSIYDIRIKSNEPILKSSLNSTINDTKKQNQSSKHTTPIWSVLWEKPAAVAVNNMNAIKDDKQDDNKDNDGSGDDNNKDSSPTSAESVHRRQSLFSIASDGIIKQWSMKKGFISSNIMSLKRVPNLAALRGSLIDNTIRSRQGSGLCFDFPLNSNNTQYYVGTEDGIIHKCSVSYNEQVLRTYYGHNGPVYNIQCSPFDENIFITCSADWTIKIWKQSKSSPLLSLRSSVNESVTDCCWSPFDSSIFASASENGILSIWNLQKNKKDPIITKDTKNSITKIMFAPNAPAILSAHKDGTIQVYRLNHINTKPSKDLNHSNQISKLNKALETDSEQLSVV